MPGLDAAAFEALLAHLDPDRAKAGEKYQVLRLKLVKFFEWNKCQQSEELADEVLNRLAARISSVDVRDLGQFALGIARYVRREAVRRATRHVELSESSAMGSDDTETSFIEQVERHRIMRCLQACLGELTVKERELLSEFFKPIGKLSEHRVRLAAANDISIGTLRTRVCRLRHRLETCVDRCRNMTKPTLRLNG
jgi:DNA-directed RNA polymerase specialized sigma24 family protein